MRLAGLGPRRPGRALAGRRRPGPTGPIAAGAGAAAGHDPGAGHGAPLPERLRQRGAAPWSISRSTTTSRRRSASRSSWRRWPWRPTGRGPAPSDTSGWRPPTRATSSSWAAAVGSRVQNYGGAGISLAAFLRLGALDGLNFTFTNGVRLEAQPLHRPADAGAGQRPGTWCRSPSRGASPCSPRGPSAPTTGCTPPPACATGCRATVGRRHLVHVRGARAGLGRRPARLSPSRARAGAPARPGPPAPPSRSASSGASERAPTRPIVAGFRKQDGSCRRKIGATPWAAPRCRQG